jgi:hypothetical protein
MILSKIHGGSASFVCNTPAGDLFCDGLDEEAEE